MIALKLDGKSENGGQACVSMHQCQKWVYLLFLWPSLWYKVLPIESPPPSIGGAGRLRLRRLIQEMEQMFTRERRSRPTHEMCRCKMLVTSKRTLIAVLTADHEAVDLVGRDFGFLIL